MSTIRTNAILDSAGGNTATINSIPLRPGILDPQNLIINGAFDFWQRGTSFTTSGYGADRWGNSFSGGSCTMSRQSFALGDTLGSSSPTYYLRQSVSGQTLASHLAVVQQLIEGVRSCAGQTITVLGWARRASGSGNMAVSVTQNFGTGGSPSAVVDVAGQTVSLTGSFAPFAVTFAIPSVTGKTLGTNGNDWLGVNFWTSAGSNFNAQTNSLGLQTIGVDFWGIHIKLGTHTVDAVSLYKQPELGPELARCQRYYQRAYIRTGAGATTTTVLGVAGLAPSMRAVPGVTTTGAITLTDGYASNPAQSSGQATFSSGSTEFVYVSLGNFTGVTVGRLYFAGVSTNPLAIDAEL